MNSITNELVAYNTGEFSLIVISGEIKWVWLLLFAFELRIALLVHTWLNLVTNQVAMEDSGIGKWEGEEMENLVWKQKKNND